MGTLWTTEWSLIQDLKVKATPKYSLLVNLRFSSVGILPFLNLSKEPLQLFPAQLTTSGVMLTLNLLSAVNQFLLTPMLTSRWKFLSATELQTLMLSGLTEVSSHNPPPCKEMSACTFIIENLKNMSPLLLSLTVTTKGVVLRNGSSMIRTRNSGMTARLKDSALTIMDFPRPLDALMPLPETVLVSLPREVFNGLSTIEKTPLLLTRAPVKPSR